MKLNYINSESNKELLFWEIYVKETLKDNDSSHDWEHINIVRNTSLYLQEHEGGDRDLIEICALLHDVLDRKYSNEDVKLSLHTALYAMYTDNIVEKILAIVNNVSFSSEIKNDNSNQLIEKLGIQKELAIVQDADRLDAIGARGIVRAFIYGETHNKPMFNPDTDTNLDIKLINYNDYIKTDNSSTFKHFYDKLLHLSKMMKTETGKLLAKDRHQFTLDFLNNFKNEWCLTKNKLINNLSNIMN